VDENAVADRPPTSRRTVFWWVAAIVVGVLVIVGVLVATNETVGPLTAAQRTHAISLQQFDALPLGPSQAEVIETLGKTPASTQSFTSTRGSPSTRINSSCIYYHRIDKPFGQGFQLCLDKGDLSGKLEY
jgi:hypothetical protein